MQDKTIETDRHYSVSEVATMWRLSQDVVRKIFEDEPGVLKYGHGEKRFRRRYVTLRIPERVLKQVHGRLTTKIP